MTALLSLFLIITAVKQPYTPLRDGCSTDAEVVATLDAGAPLKIRYALAGESTPCYKVTVEVAGKTLDGFMPASAIAGLDEFEKGLRDASWPDPEKVIGSIKAAAQQMPSLAGATLANTQAAALIESSQPGKALELLENELRVKNDPTTLALAGVAA